VGCEYKIPNEVSQLISSCTNANKEHNPFCLKSKSSYIASPSLICGCKPIIIVDDSSFNLMVLEEFLKKLGLSAEKAFNGKDACSILSKYSKCHCSNLKCILTDCEMPIMNGFEEAIKMREHMQMGQWKRVPIIAVTAYSDELTKNKCFDCGMDAHISKPVMINELKATLQQYNVL
jgi:CheY-like chemotaxis protein